MQMACLAVETFSVSNLAALELAQYSPKAPIAADAFAASLIIPTYQLLIEPELIYKYEFLLWL